ncbi:hypothetical protein [Liquorilactobacillus vini]|uniref:hypothetical protein n=1 Tax=Liquorilactobacillus vini TaxID=238015 RepID=UPI0002F893E8|nr:hypothetical protein [Liquorilactobacillus vini]
MRNNIVYVHIEKVSHLTLTYGISIIDFLAGIKKKPENVLSLGVVDPSQEIDIYSGFNMYIGQNQVQSFLLSQAQNDLQWIDFDHSFDLESLTPQEVAEMLYLGHAFTHLKSPFYYKLQNDFVYLTLPNGANKIYYRYLPSFYRVLSKSLTRHLTVAYREKRTFFLRKRIADFPETLVRQLLTLLIGGAVFDFGNTQIHGQELTVSLLTAPESVYQLKWHEPTMLIEKSSLVGNLKYNLTSRKWQLIVLSPEAFEDNLNF